MAPSTMRSVSPSTGCGWMNKAGSSTVISPTCITTPATARKCWPWADGKVVGMLNDLDDQKPGKLPDPDTITIDTVDGNHVVLDIGGGYFAFYAHLQKNSVTVRVGDQVKKGAVLGKLGNSGNTSGPHLHFHIMTGPSVLGSDGVPYVIDSFTLAGQIDIAAFEAAPDLTGNWGKGLLSKTERHEGDFPLNLNIIDFPPPQNSK